MKQALKALLRSVASRAPQGARCALLDGCLDAMSVHEMYTDLLPRLKISEVAASGDRGTILSSAGDTFVITEYAQTGTFAPTVTGAIKSFFTPAGGTYLDIGANIGLMTVPFPANLVPQVVHSAGYNPFSFTRASAVVNCQSALTCLRLRVSSQAATSSMRLSVSGIRRSRH